jgi:hypothetical protein
MRTTIGFLLVAAVGLVPAAVLADLAPILIDFNQTRAEIGGGAEQLATGADFNAALERAVYDPTSTAIPFFEDDVDNSNTWNGITVTASGPLPGSWINDVFDGQTGAALLNDYLSLATGDNTRDITISGLNLDPGTPYYLWLFGVGDGPGQEANFTYGGLTLGTPVDDPRDPVDVTKWEVRFLVPADADRDSVTFTWSNGDDAEGSAGLNGVAMEAIPEPGTVFLLAVGVLGLVRRTGRPPSPVLEGRTRTR